MCPEGKELEICGVSTSDNHSYIISRFKANHSQFIVSFCVWLSCVVCAFFQIIIFIGSDCKRVPTDYSLTFASAEETKEFPWSRICS